MYISRRSARSYTLSSSQYSERRGSPTSGSVPLSIIAQILSYAACPILCSFLSESRCSSSTPAAGATFWCSLRMLCVK